MHHYMVVIRHNGVGADVDTENTAKFFDPGLNPIPAVLIASLSRCVVPTQEGAADTTRNAVVVRRGIQTDLLAPGSCHHFPFWL